VKQLELELKELNFRVGNVELKNKDQDEAILFLKTRRDTTLSTMKQNEFIEPRHHQAYYESNNKTADYIDDGGGGGKGTMRLKRPFRLLPASQPKTYKLSCLFISINFLGLFYFKKLITTHIVITL